MLSWHRFIEVIKRQRIQTVKERFIDSLDRSRARQRLQNAHLPEKITRTKARQLNFIRLAKMTAHPHQAFGDEKKAVPRFAFPNHNTPSLSLALRRPLPQQVQGVLIQSSQDMDVVQHGRYGLRLLSGIGPTSGAAT